MRPTLLAFVAAMSVTPLVVVAQDRHESAGVAVTTTIRGAEDGVLRAGELARVTLAVADSRSGRAYAGVRPRAWLSARRSEMVSTEASCRDKIRGFVGGALAARADVDLNASFYLTLNDDGTVAFINPLIAWNRTKLEAIVKLPTPGLDWALSVDQRSLYVTLPESRGVALIDTESRQLVRVVDLPSEGRPTRVAVSPRDGSVWVGADSAGVVHVLDAELGQAQSVQVGLGRHLLAFDGDGQKVAITSAEDNSVTIVDVTGRRVLARVAVPGTPLRVVWSSGRGAFYVSTLNRGTLVRIVSDPWRAAEPLVLDAGLVDLGVETTGRYLFAVNQVRSRVDVIDTATDRVRARVGVAAQPDQITFTKRFAYVRSLGAETFSVVDLGPLSREGTEDVELLTATDIQAGLQRPSVRPDQIGVARMIVPLTEGNGALVASGPERRLFYYLEGMFAPMGTFDNYRRTPRAVMILDRGLREGEPGHFETSVTLPAAGAYDVAVLTDQPQVAHCFSLRVAPSLSPAVNDAPVTVTGQAALGADARDVTLTFRLTGDGDEPVHGVRDARVVVFQPPGVWQTSVWLIEHAPGVYGGRVRLPGGGAYAAAFDAASLTPRVRGLRVVSVTVPADPR